jgi:pilus assembly protein CpaF
MISSALDMVVQVSRLADGTRKVTSIAEVVGMEGEVITLQDIFVFDRQGIDADGKVIGRFHATGIRPKFADKLEVAGIDLPEDLFFAHKYFE